METGRYLLRTHNDVACLFSYGLLCAPHGKPVPGDVCSVFLTGEVFGWLVEGLIRLASFGFSFTQFVFVNWSNFSMVRIFFFHFDYKLLLKRKIFKDLGCMSIENSRR